MLRQLSAVFLAILVANPLCCCLGERAAHPESTPAKECCGASHADQEPGLPTDDHSPCDCHSLGRLSLFSDPTVVMDAPSRISPNSVDWIEVARVEWAPYAGIGAPPHLGPGPPRAATGRELTQVNCVLLL